MKKNPRVGRDAVMAALATRAARRRAWKDLARWRERQTQARHQKDILHTPISVLQYKGASTIITPRLHSFAY